MRKMFFSVTKIYTNFKNQMKSKMKKIIVSTLSILILTVLVVISCNREGSTEEILNPKIENLLNSKTLARHSSFINSFGDIKKDKILYQEIIIENVSYDYFNVPLYKNGEEIAYLEIAKIKNTQFLPNNDEYLINLVDKSKYDRINKIGKIEMYDVNYDNYKHSTIIAKNDKIVDWNSKGLSKNLRNKYSKIINPKKRLNLAARHLCDYNGNGNISFSECYSCIDNAIETNATSSTICWAAQFWGPRASWCGVSVAVSCSIISSIY